MQKIIYTILILLVAYSAGYSQQWTVVPSPNPNATRNILLGVHAVSSNDVWAVGVQGVMTLTMHWNGSAWTVINSPNPGPSSNTLYDVYGFSSNDIIAVGMGVYAAGVPQMLAIRWNGSSWSTMNTPTVFGGSTFQTVLAFSPNDIYAGGNKMVGAPGPTTGTLVSHWDGSSWEILNTPHQSMNRSNYITDMDGLSTNDIWAVGYSREIAANFQAMVLHKSGSTWSIVPVPQPGSENFLYSVDVISQNNIWAAGSYNNGTTYLPLFLHYNGSTWTVVNSPGGGASTVSNSANDIWSAGSSIVHYNGTSWNSVSAPIPSSGNIQSLSRLSSSEIWGVGRYIEGEVFKTLVLRYTTITGSEKESNNIPESFKLFQNFPNPFNPVTNIRFEIPKSQFVKLAVYDLLGREIKILVNEFKNAGTYELQIDAAELSSGTYFYKLESEEFSVVKKMMIIK